VAVEFLSDDQVVAYGRFTARRSAVRFLADPLDAPSAVADYLAGQVGVADASSVKRYAGRQATQWERAAEIRRVYGYRDFADPDAQRKLRALDGGDAGADSASYQAILQGGVTYKITVSAAILFAGGLRQLERRGVITSGSALLDELARTYAAGTPDLPPG
jgi:hypothetical protein